MSTRCRNKLSRFIVKNRHYSWPNLNRLISAAATETRLDKGLIRALLADGLTQELREYEDTIIVLANDAEGEIHSRIVLREPIANTMRYLQT